MNRAWVGEEKVRKQREEIENKQLIAEDQNLKQLC